MHGEIPDWQFDDKFDGGEETCGRVIIYLHLYLRTQPSGYRILVVSRDPGAPMELPAWCRMVGHEYLGSLPAAGFVRYFVRRRASLVAEAETQALARDKQDAKSFEWRARVRSAGHQHAKVYARNFFFDIGQPASFEEKNSYPSAIEYLLGAIAGSLVTGCVSDCARAGLDADDIEISISARLHNVLAHLGVEAGDPSFETTAVKCFVSTFEDEDTVKSVWAGTVNRSSLVSTLKKGTGMDIRLSIA